MARSNNEATTNVVQERKEQKSPSPKKKTRTMTVTKAKKGGSKQQSAKAKNIQQIFQHQQNDLMQQMNRVLTSSSHKQEIFAELSQTPGITRTEILRELEALSDETAAATSADDVLMMIVGKREMLKSAHQSNEAQLKAQEDAILDQVILLSEGERENIQVCLYY